MNFSYLINTRRLEIYRYSSEQYTQKRVPQAQQNSKHTGNGEYTNDLFYVSFIACAERDGTRAETTFRLSPKRTSPFKSLGASVQSTAGSRGVRISGSIARAERDGTRTETRFRLSPKRTSPFKSLGASVQSTAGSRGVRISGSNAGYTMFRGSVKSTGYPFHSPVSPSLPLPCVTVCRHISTGVYDSLPKEAGRPPPSHIHTLNTHTHTHTKTRRKTVGRNRLILIA